jgi:hypothetical protein
MLFHGSRYGQTGSKRRIETGREILEAVMINYTTDLPKDVIVKALEKAEDLELGERTRKHLLGGSV